MICYLFSEPAYLLFTSGVPGLLYYSHIPTAIIAILIGFFILWNDKQSLLNRLLFSVLICFSLWIFSNLILWTNIHSDFMLFIWSFLRVLSSLISILSVYFIYVFLEKKDVSILLKSIFLALIVPVIVLAPTIVNLSGFNITSCDAFIFEGSLFQFIRIAFGVLAMVWILFLLIKKYHKAEIGFKRQILLMGIGIEFFLFSFFTVTFLVDYLTKIGVLSDSRLEFYGLFGMDVFIIYLSILIVRFKAFNIKLFATQALVWGLSVLIGSQFFFISGLTSIILNTFTFIASIILGYFLIRSVKIEIEQKERLAKLDIDLENLLKQRESLMHLITHKVKGSFTRTKILFASMLDGTFGDTTPEIKKRAQQGFDFDNDGIATVDLVLNAANMQSGTIKYEMNPIDFKEIVEKTITEKRIPAENRGLKLEETEIKEGNYGILGDAIWIKEAVNNLIENSIKYTKEGSITVGLEKKADKLLLSVKDTGVGITDDDKQNLFKEGGRGKDSIKVNVDSTGYGLFTVKLVIEGHKGRVWAESAGAGKGSQFYIELPAMA